uniref:Uncharacterized protein n=1 Tax=Acrobeloides nanus TaxID=290746 RepID=A0A914D873_9BILA
MPREEIEDFLNSCDQALIQLMKKMGFRQNKINASSSSLRQKILTVLLESDILTADTYADGDAKSNPKEELEKTDTELMERSNQMIKLLLRQLLDKDQELKMLKDRTAGAI